MSVTVSMINMKGGVGKSTLAFNLAWYAARFANLRVLAVDIDPQSNLSQYFMGDEGYVEYLDSDGATVVEVFEQFTPPKTGSGSPTPLNLDDVIHNIREWDGGRLDLVPSRLELAWNLKNPGEKASRLPRFLSKIADDYDLILIDCPPTESILTNAAYLSSRHIVVPVRPEFLATVGLPLLSRSLEDFKQTHKNHSLDMAGIIFNGLYRTDTPPEQRESRKVVKRLAGKYNWPVFKNAVNHSRSYPSGSRVGRPIFSTGYARDHVISEFSKVAREFLKAVGAT